METNGVLQYISIATTTIAVLMAYIAWQQLAVNRRKIALDLFEKRYVVYNEIRKLLSAVFTNADLSLHELRTFISAVHDADFLFDKEIREYIDELYRRGCNLSIANEKLKDNDPDMPKDMRDKIVSDKYKEIEWLTDQFVPAKQIFMKYLDFHKVLK